MSILSFGNTFGPIKWPENTQKYLKAQMCLVYTGCFFLLVRPKNDYKSQPLKEFSELVLSKKRLRMEKFKYQNWFYSTVEPVQIL